MREIVQAAIEAHKHHGEDWKLALYECFIPVVREICSSPNEAVKVTKTVLLTNKEEYLMDLVEDEELALDVAKTIVRFANVLLEIEARKKTAPHSDEESK